MRVTMATAAAWAGRTNEDFVGAIPTAVVVIDGAGIPGTESICSHGVAWYATRLGGSLLALLARSPDVAMPGLLGSAIDEVTDVHRATCDVTSPVSPSATVAMLRVSDGVLEYLVLGDTFVVLDVGSGAPIVVSDPREVSISRRYEAMLEGVAAGSDEYQRIVRELRAHRNQPGGFWLAKDDRRAADEAITGSHPVDEASGAVLPSTGASRIVDRFALTDWRGFIDLLGSGGAADIIHRVRQAEARHDVTADDATVAHCIDFEARE